MKKKWIRGVNLLLIGSIKPLPAGKDLKSIQIDIHHASKGHIPNFVFLLQV